MKQVILDTNIFTDETTKNIYAGTTEDFSFLWRTTKNTLPGNYVITMKSYVPDTKCDQTNITAQGCERKIPKSVPSSHPNGILNRIFMHSGAFQTKFGAIPFDSRPILLKSGNWHFEE